MITPTAKVYGGLDDAYNALNDGLFDGELPSCLLTLQRKNKVYGYFCGERFGKLDDDDTARKVDEIAINPAYNNLREPAEILSTLAHEMVHLWQHHFGLPTRTNPHNVEWGTKMKSIGLKPFGKNGKETGRNVSHIIDPDGLFASIAGAVLKVADIASLGDIQSSEPTPVAKSGKYAKYECAKCGVVARGKPNLDLRCGDHGKMVQA